jgi:hypothetical protein
MDIVDVGWSRDAVDWAFVVDRKVRRRHDGRHRDPVQATKDVERQDLLLDLCRKVSGIALTAQ